MAPQLSQQPLFSPSELAYLHTSLSLRPPIRPDGRSPTTFRPLSAEADFVDSANGSARLFYADGTEAIVGVKSEVQRSYDIPRDEGVATAHTKARRGGSARAGAGDETGGAGMGKESGVMPASRANWVEVTLDVPGAKDDDTTVAFLTQMLHEGLVADGALEERLYINRRWHWKLFIDILLLSPPYTYPLPLLSLTTHLALLTTRLPALVSSKNNDHDAEEEDDDDNDNDDPLFNDDWAAAAPLYPSAHDDDEDRHDVSRNNLNNHKRRTLGKEGEKKEASSNAMNSSPSPPVALLVAAVGENIFFDPSGEELAVADVVLAVTIAWGGLSPRRQPRGEQQQQELEKEGEGPVRVLAVRMVDAPAKLTSAVGAGGEEVDEREGEDEEGVWRPKRGGVSRGLVKRMVGLCGVGRGVGEEVLRGMGEFLGPLR